MDGQKIFFITGSSGIGKTTLARNLKNLLPDQYKVYDFDERGVPPDADLLWRKKTTLGWLETAEENRKEGIGTIVVGLSQPDEVTELNSAYRLAIRFVLLDASDKEIEKRLYAYRFSTPHRIANLLKYTGQTPEQFIAGENKNHANLLRKLAKEYNAIILETDGLTPEIVAGEVVKILTKNN